MFNVRHRFNVGFLLLITSALSGCSSSAPSVPEASASPASASTSAAAADVAIQIVRIPVEGMSCVACAANVKKTLVAIAGVEHVEVHLGERNAQVRFNSQQVTTDKLVTVINGLGYSAGTPIPVGR